MTTVEKTAVLLLNTGSPSAPTPEALRDYLEEFLSDPRVVNWPRWLWMPILKGIILKRRPAKSALRYQGIWTQEGSPLIAETERAVAKLNETLNYKNIQVFYAMRYGEPKVKDIVQKITQEGFKKLLVMPLFAQYGTATTEACRDAVLAAKKALDIDLDILFLQDYATHDAYIEALKDEVEHFWAKQGKLESEQAKLLMSFHGVPQSYSDRGDPYEKRCHETAQKLAFALHLNQEQWAISFQSRFGPQKWIQPYTDQTVEKWGESKTVSRIDVICPGFSFDCLETIEEINDELRKTAKTSNAQMAFHYIPCLNASESAVKAYSAIIEEIIENSDRQGLEKL